MGLCDLWEAVSTSPVFGVVLVSRGGHVSMDVSADLTELGRTPVAVVCAGAKSVSALAMDSLGCQEL